jgi:hypothetical protein
LCAIFTDSAIYFAYLLAGYPEPEDAGCQLLDMTLKTNTQAQMIKTHRIIHKTALHASRSAFWQEAPPWEDGDGEKFLLHPRQQFPAINWREVI